MLDAVILYLANVLPFYRAAQDANIDMFMADLRAMNESLNPPKE